jgi:hypothetical protein
MTVGPQTSTFNNGVGIAPLVVEPVAGLRELGTGVVFPLPLEHAAFRIGACQDLPETHAPVMHAGMALDTLPVVVVARPYVSKRHALIERRGAQLKITNLASKNGVVVDGVRTEQVTIGAGAVLRLGDTELLAVTSSALHGTPALELRFGYDAHAVIDRLLMAGMGNWSAAIIGPPRTGLREVPALLRAMSRLRQRPLIVPRAAGDLEPAVAGFHSGVILDVDQLPRLPKVAPRVAAALA